MASSSESIEVFPIDGASFVEYQDTMRTLLDSVFPEGYSKTFLKAASSMYIFGAATESDELVGVCGVDMESTRHDLRVGDAVLSFLAVRPTYHRQGIGRLLVHAAEDATAAEGYQRMVLTPQEGSEDFHEAMGYIEQAGNTMSKQLR